MFRKFFIICTAIIFAAFIYGNSDIKNANAAARDNKTAVAKDNKIKTKKAKDNKTDEDAAKLDSSPVNVQSDAMRYYGVEKKSIFTGNVVAFNNQFTLTADNVTVFFSDQSSADKINCVGNVNFKTKDIVSVSNFADVDERIKLAILTGKVNVWQGENFLEGEKVYIYYAENRIVVDKGSESRVMIIFKPDEKEKKDGVKDNRSPEKLP